MLLCNKNDFFSLEDIILESFRAFFDFFNRVESSPTMTGSYCFNNNRNGTLLILKNKL